MYQTGVPSTIGVAIIGSGFSGLAMAVELKRAGRDDFVILERANDVAGTWRDNTYPGCACDVPSHLYSFGFAPNPEWSSTFSPQPEIQAYIKRVAEHEGLLPHVRFGIEVESAAWDDDGARGSTMTKASSGLIQPAVSTGFHSARCVGSLLRYRPMFTSGHSVGRPKSRCSIGWMSS